MAAKYLAADTVGIKLLQSKKGDLWGADRKFFALGPWTLSLWVEVVSDCMEHKQCGLFVKFTNRLWLYVWITSSGTRLYVLDAEAIGLNDDTRDTFKGANPKETVSEIKAAVRGVYEYSMDKEVWVKVESKKV